MPIVMEEKRVAAAGFQRGESGREKRERDGWSRGDAGRLRQWRLKLWLLPSPLSPKESALSFFHYDRCWSCSSLTPPFFLGFPCSPESLSCCYLHCCKRVGEGREWKKKKIKKKRREEGDRKKHQWRKDVPKKKIEREHMIAIGCDSGLSRLHGWKHKQNRGKLTRKRC
ncbi:hypothetical protein PIB30_065732 [Stylosanthes scabra]|uniref:Uncharacterized protein n=1 Tax=Stylosanthes scabra TaxID=79078 RepID=A0ABU6SNG4_9FABA|nr:hypothetical protein [Stylosanthes scabra]